MATSMDTLMSSSNPTSNAVAPQTFKQSLSMAVITASFTLIAATSSTLLGWLSSYQTNLANQQLNCLARLDTLESNLRAKGEAFLNPLASFTAYIHHSVNLEELNTRAETVMRNGYTFAAYAPPELSKTTYDLTLEITKMAGYRDEKAWNEAAEKANELKNTWNRLYFQVMNSFEVSREQCLVK